MNDLGNIKLTQMNEQANASAKSKELQCYPKTDTIAAHLLLPDRTIDIPSLNHIEITAKLVNNL